MGLYAFLIIIGIIVFVFFISYFVLCAIDFRVNFISWILEKSIGSKKKNKPKSETDIDYYDWDV